MYDCFQNEGKKAVIVLREIRDEFVINKTPAILVGKTGTIRYFENHAYDTEYPNGSEGCTYWLELDLCPEYGVILSVYGQRDVLGDGKTLVPVDADFVRILDEGAEGKQP